MEMCVRLQTRALETRAGGAFHHFINGLPRRVLRLRSIRLPMAAS
jgi:hypothetical protein